MGKPTGFMEFPRLKRPWRDASERSLDYYEIYTPPNKDKLKLIPRDKKAPKLCPAEP